MNTNGILSFRYPFFRYVPRQFPLTSLDILIAPFWDDVNILVNGSIFFRFTANPALLNQVGSFCREVFGSEMDPLLLFIVTWYAVAGYDFPNQVYIYIKHTYGGTSLIKGNLYVKDSFKLPLVFKVSMCSLKRGFTVSLQRILYHSLCIVTSLGKFFPSNIGH